VIDLGYVFHIFDVRIDDTISVLEERRKIAATDVTIFIDCCCQYRTAILPVPSGIISPSSKEGNSERRSTDNHSIFSQYGNGGAEHSGHE
jgi:hypothetical protein